MPAAVSLTVTRRFLSRGKPLGEQGELVVMRGEERACADLLMQMLDCGPCEGKAIVCCGAAAHLIQQYKAAGRSPCSGWRRSRSSRP